MQMFLTFVCLLLIAASLGAQQKFESDTIPTSRGELAITFFGHATLMLSFGGMIIHVDPWSKLADYSKLPKTDVILVTHDHSDHFDTGAIARLRKNNTVIVYTKLCSEKLPGGIVMKNGEKQTVKGLEVEAVPAYNTNKKFHPKANGWVGYVFTIGGRRIYLAGDTDYIPEMKSIKCDIALLPVSGTYVMTAEEAAQAALDIGPRVAVPMHYGTLSGSAENARRFRDLLAGKIEVVLLEKE